MVMFACELERQRKLDLSAPLMSVRRHQQPDTPTTTTATSDEEEEQNELDEAWESMRSPGAVPFVWERTPGRPKAVDSRRSRHHQQAQPPPPPPPPPPGRVASPLHDSWRSGGGGGLFKRRLPSFLVKAPAAATARGSSASQLKDRQAEQEEDEEYDAFSDAKQTENWTAATELEDEGGGGARGGDSPAARDFIMRRFLPAAKAMADESSSATPFRSFLDKKNGTGSEDRAPPATKQVAATMPPRSPSVERIQAWQYKFSGGGGGRRRRQPRSDSGSGGDFFAMRACGFFSMGLLRRRLPASRLRRSDSSNGGDREVKQPSPAPSSSSASPSPGARKPATEAFYDTETSFAARIFSPQTAAASPYRTPAPSTAVDDSRGFLGLPQDYKPPEDPYRNAGRLQDKNGSYAPRSRTPEHNHGDGSRDAVVGVNNSNNKEPSALPLPPKSPSQPWLWSAVPPPPGPMPSTKWEVTVKSRQLRAGHLRYSEEDALQPCKY